MSVNEIKKSEDPNEIEFYFKDEEKLLNDAIVEIDDLYDEVKGHYDDIKKASRSANGGRGILSFVEKQTSNLVSLKNAKANLITNKITLKKTAMELALKQKKDMDESQINNDLVNAVLEQIESRDEDSIIVESNYNEEDSSNFDPDELLESRIASLKASGDIEDDEEVDSSEEEGALAVRVKNKKWSFVGINEMGKIIKGFPVPNKKDYKMRLRKDEEKGQIAIDQNGKIYTVIKK
jgi:hypothetical protein